MTGSTIRSALFVCLAGFLPVLAVPSAAAAKTYKGAEYRTKASYLYGRFEVRARAIGREGTLSSFFTYNDDYPNTPWNEIDIEILGRYTDDVQCNTITPGQVNHVSHQFVQFNPALDYHVYGFEWTPDYVAWFIDGVEAVRQTGSHIGTLTHPQKIMMNVWIPTQPNWVGPWNEAVLPAFASYDWVSYSSYTPGSGSGGTDNNFTHQWTDSLDSWDETRWDKASHTWPGNDCDFVHENVTFQNGILTLCLTKASPLGHVDTAPPAVLWARAEGSHLRLAFSEDVDRTSAETAGNYVIPGVTVADATLLPDRKTVLLSAPGLDTLSVSALLVQNVRDCWTPANVMSISPVIVIRSSPLSFPLSVNVGGSAQPGYLADREWTPLTEYGWRDGQTAYFDGASIAGTSEQEIFRSEHFGLCEYAVRVPDGRYQVVLMMAENYHTSAGLRKMAIVVEGTEVETALDLIARVGFRTAYQSTVTVDVSDGVLDIHFQALADQPLLNGFTVMRVTTGLGSGTDNDPLPGSVRLYPSYPNPFNGGTMIGFSLPRRDRLTLQVFDSIGKIVDSRSLGEFPGGDVWVSWDPHAAAGGVLSSGVYYYRLVGTTRSPVQRMVYLK